MNPLYRLLTTVQVFANNKEELVQTYNDDYSPYGYVQKSEPTLVKDSWFKMVVCKDLLL